MDAVQVTQEERLTELLHDGKAVKHAAKQVSAEFGVRKKHMYDIALRIQARLQEGDDQTSSPS